jgi:hypothetical protein
LSHVFNILDKDPLFKFQDLIDYIKRVVKFDYKEIYRKLLRINLTDLMKFDVFYNDNPLVALENQALENFIDIMDM